MDTLFILGYVAVCLEGACGIYIMYKCWPWVARFFKVEKTLDRGPAANDDKYIAPTQPTTIIVRTTNWD